MTKKVSGVLVDIVGTAGVTAKEWTPVLVSAAAIKHIAKKPKVAKKKWFRKAVMKKPPYKLGWKKTQSTSRRRQVALASRPKNWKLKTRYLSTARALTSLSNVTKDRRTKTLARADAKYFYKRYRGMK